MGTGKDFTSDNASGAAQEVLAAIAEANSGTALAYGEDACTQHLKARLGEIFEHEVEVFPMFTGTAANALALSCLVPPFGAAFCHRQAHIYTSECGAPEFFTGGARLVGLDGEGALISAEALRSALAELGSGVTHHFQPAALSITQASECGTLYSLKKIRELTDIARAHGLKTHMDGARLANALAAMTAKPADITWRSGIDVVSFGLTKDGALAAEAVIFFDKTLAAEARYRQKRAGQVASKMRFVSAQLLALLKDDLWLALAARANEQAKRMAQGALAGAIPLAFPAEINEVFLRLDRGAADGLRALGYGFHPWDAEPARGVCTYRFVTSFATEARDVEELLGALGRLARA